MLTIAGNMTFMMESSRSLLFTKWGLDAGTDEATDPAVWDRMPVCTNSL